jgi:hypothetical protein
MTPFWKTVTGMALVIIMLCVATVHAEQGFRLDRILHEIRIGGLVHDVDELWSGIRVEQGIDFNLETSFTPHLKLINGSLRPALGVSINSAGDTSKLYLDGRWQYTYKSSFFIALGLGVAVHNGQKEPADNDMKALGSNILFHVPLELGLYWKTRFSLSLFFDHVSNANLASYNEGLDTLGLRIGYRF